MKIETEEYMSGATKGGGHGPRVELARELMTREVISVRPEVSLSGAAELMLENEISGLPVVDRKGRLVGMVTKTDVVRANVTSDGAPVDVRRLPSGVHEISSTTVGDVMTRRALTVLPDSTLQEVASVLMSGRVHRVPVVTREGELVGLISASDIARWVAQSKP